jgi:putative transposase
MPRQARIDAPGAIHHIIVRGIERRKIFLNDQDRLDFVKRLGDLGWVRDALYIYIFT